MRQALLAVLLASLATGALAQNKGLPALTARGTVVGSDYLPIQPSGGASLMNTTAGAVKAYVTTSIDAFGADPTGGSDSTSAIQAALNSGLPLTCQGVYKTTATLTVETAASDGQTLTGGGSWGTSSTAPAGACVIRPTSAVTTAIVIDGTPFNSWVEGFAMAHLVIDMTNMTDASTTAAIEQIQGFDESYNGVRVINDGTSKRSWLFKAGAYTTTIIGGRGNIVDLEGTAANNAATSISLLNADIGQLDGNYAGNVTVVGGAIQPVYNSGMTAVYLAANDPTTPQGLVNTGGLYLIVAESMTNTDGLDIDGTFIGNNGAYPTTYNDGTHGSLSAFPVLEIPASLTRAFLAPAHLSGMYLYDLSGSASAFGANIGGGAAGNTIDAPTIFPGGVTIPSTAQITVGSAQTWPGMHIKPASDGDQILTVALASGASLLDCSTGANACVFNNGASIFGFSDDYSTQSFGLETVSSAGQLFLATSGGSKTIQLIGANGTIETTGGVSATYGYSANSTAGVSCAANTVSLTTLVVTEGIVTHC